MTSSVSSSSGGAQVRVAIVGLGAIGREVLKAVQARPGLTLVAVADPAPELVGRDAGELSGIAACGVKVAVCTLATGGTVSATINLVERLEGKVVAVAFLVELTALKGRDRLQAYEVISLLKF